MLKMRSIKEIKMKYYKVICSALLFIIWGGVAQGQSDDVFFTMTDDEKPAVTKSVDASASVLKLPPVVKTWAK
jgi:hypothetical protein